MSNLQSRPCGVVLACAFLSFALSASCATAKSAVEDLAGPLKSKLPDITVTYLTSLGWESSQSFLGQDMGELGMSPGAGVLFSLGGGDPKKWYWDIEAGLRAARGEGETVLLPDLETLTLMAGGYRGFDLEGKLDGFAGLGLGIARHAALEAHDYAFAWHASIGVSYELTETISGEFALRYFGTQDSVVGGIGFSYGRPELGVGVKIAF